MVDAALVAAAAGADAIVPGSGPAVKVITSAIAKQVKSTTPDAKIQKAITDSYQEWVAELAEKVRALELTLQAVGLHVDQRLYPERIQILKEFIDDMSAARSEKKRESVTNAAARQFDPRAGTEAARHFWYRRLNDLSDLQLELLLALGTSRLGASRGIFYRITVNTLSGANPLIDSKELEGLPGFDTPSDHYAAEQALATMRPPGNDLVDAGAFGFIKGANGEADRGINLFSVSPVGRMLLKFASDPTL